MNFNSGFRAPIETISHFCRQRDVWLVVDAVQAVGALKVDVESLGADLVSAHGYKSLCSGFGISICYIAPALRDVLASGIPAGTPVPG